MGISYDDIPAAVYDAAIREQFGSPEYALDDSNPNWYNFVCPNPACGDFNRPNKKKAYIYTDSWQYVCYKCTAMMSFGRWLKEHDKDAYDRMIFSAFGSRAKMYGKQLEAPKPEPKPVDVSLPFKPGEIIPILSDHPLAKAGLEICKNRRIREEVYSEWFVCLPGDQFLNRDSEGNYILGPNGKPTGNEYRNRIIIPFYQFGGKWTQFDARAIDPNHPLRYRNFTGVRRSAYNIDFINYDETIYILEGTIDSTFIRNSIAIGGIQHFDEIITQNPKLAENKDKIVVLWDNDPAGRKARAGTTCDMGYRWFTWEGITSKDVNGAVMTGEFPLNAEGYVDDNFIKARTRDPEGAKIIFTMKYGNIKKDEARKKFDALKAYREGRKKSKVEVLF